MRKTNAVGAVRRFQFSCGNKRRFVISGDYLFVNRASDLITFYRHRNFLRDRLADAGSFVYGRIRDRSAATHLKRCRTKSADNKSAVSVSSAIQITLLVGTEIVTRYHAPIRMRVIVEIHVLGLGKRRADGVISFGNICRVPVGYGRTGCDVKAVTLLGKLCAVESKACGRLFGVDLSRPALYQNAAPSDSCRWPFLGRNADESDKKYGNYKHTNADLIFHNAVTLSPIDSRFNASLTSRRHTSRHNARLLY